jgi:HSP20 family protein
MNMNIVKYDPFRELRSLQDEMTRLFTGVMPTSFNREEMTHGAWAPSVDIYEDKDNFVVKAELPGMKKEDIDVSLHDGSLSISGERKSEEKVEDGEVYRSERYFGRFQRTVALPATVDAGKIKAQYQDGVLTVTLPKAEEAKPKQIDVQVN